MNPIISVNEARKLLRKDAWSMSDEEVEHTISTLPVIAKEALEQAHRKRQMKKDAMALAELTYDIYKEERPSPNKKNRR